MKRNLYEPITFFLLRIVAAVLFIQTGGNILFDWFGMRGPGPFHIVSQMGLAGILEFFGGILVLIGLATRPVTFLLSGLMAVAYFQIHAPKSLWPLVNQGMPAILLCFIFLFFSAHGAGPYSVDAVLSRRRAEPPVADAA